MTAAIAKGCHKAVPEISLSGLLWNAHGHKAWDATKSMIGVTAARDALALLIDGVSLDNSVGNTRNRIRDVVGYKYA